MHNRGLKIGRNLERSQNANLHHSIPQKIAKTAGDFGHWVKALMSETLI